MQNKFVAMSPVEASTPPIVASVEGSRVARSVHILTCLMVYFSLCNRVTIAHRVNVAVPRNASVQISRQVADFRSISVQVVTHVASPKKTSVLNIMSESVHFVTYGLNIIGMLLGFLMLK